MPELIINKSGEIKKVPAQEKVIFEDKKPHVVDEESILRHLLEAKRIHNEMEVGQKEARVTLKPQHPELPAYIWLNCDDHLGSVLVDYESFLRDYNIVKETPNFYVISNGDEVDNFMVTLGKNATGVYEDPITPEQQSRLFQKMFKNLDDMDKVLAMSFGNHNQWIRGAGYKFQNTWLANFKAPVLNCGGVLTINYGKQEYKIAMTHRFWGNSKLNPTNAAKRYMEHQHPDADVLFLGHTHQAEFLFFRRDKEVEYRYAVIGGTYKVDDEYSHEAGLGRGQAGGFVLKLSPDKRDIEVLRNVPDSQNHFFLLQEISRFKMV